MSNEPRSLDQTHRRIPCRPDEVEPKQPHVYTIPSVPSREFEPGDTVAWTASQEGLMVGQIADVVANGARLLVSCRIWSKHLKTYETRPYEIDASEAFKVVPLDAPPSS